MKKKFKITEKNTRGYLCEMHEYGKDILKKFIMLNLKACIC